MDFKVNGYNMINWVDSAQNRDYWRDLVNAALNLRVHNPWSWLVSSVLPELLFIQFLRILSVTDC